MEDVGIPSVTYPFNHRYHHQNPQRERNEGKGGVEEYICKFPISSLLYAITHLPPHLSLFSPSVHPPPIFLRLSLKPPLLFSRARHRQRRKWALNTITKTRSSKLVSSQGKGEGERRDLNFPLFCVYKLPSLPYFISIPPRHFHFPPTSYF